MIDTNNHSPAITSDGSSTLDQIRGIFDGKDTSDYVLVEHEQPFKTAKFPQNSFALTTFLLLNTMIGSGILNQPFVFENSGLLGGSLGFLLASILTWMGLLLLTDAGLHTNIFEYSGLAKYAFGNVGEIVIDISIIISSFGAQLGYILVVGETLTSLVQSWACPASVCQLDTILVISIALFVSPFCMFRHFGHLAWLSIFSITTIVSVLLLVIIMGPLKEESGEVLLFDLSGTLRSTGSIVFSLNCASANFQAFVATEKGCRNSSSWRAITFTAVMLGTCMCMVMGAVGYTSFKNTTQGEILDNFMGHTYDFFKVMVVAHLVMYIPVNFVIMRYSIVNLVAGIPSDELSNFMHTILSLGLLAGQTAVVVALLHLGVASGAMFGLILNITGGIGGSLNAFILPALIYLTVMPDGSPLKLAGILCLLVGIVVMFAVVSVTVLSVL